MYNFTFYLVSPQAFLKAFNFEKKKEISILILEFLLSVLAGILASLVVDLFKGIGKLIRAYFEKE